MNSIPADIEGDAFGKIYGYFLGKFAASEGTGGGEFYTPTSIVRLIVEVIGTRSRRAWARWFTGPDPAPRAWDHLFDRTAGSGFD